MIKENLSQGKPGSKLMEYLETIEYAQRLCLFWEGSADNVNGAFEKKDGGSRAMPAPTESIFINLLDSPSLSEILRW